MLLLGCGDSEHPAFKAYAKNPAPPTPYEIANEAFTLAVKGFSGCKAERLKVLEDNKPQLRAFLDKPSTQLDDKLRKAIFDVIHDGILEELVVEVGELIDTLIDNPQDKKHLVFKDLYHLLIESRAVSKGPVVALVVDMFVPSFVAAFPTSYPSGAATLPFERFLERAKKDPIYFERMMKRLEELDKVTSQAERDTGKKIARATGFGSDLARRGMIKAMASPAKIGDQDVAEAMVELMKSPSYEVRENLERLLKYSTSAKHSSIEVQLADKVKRLGSEQYKKAFAAFADAGKNGDGAKKAAPPNIEKMLKFAGFIYHFLMLSPATKCATAKLPWEKSESELFAALKTISAFLKDKDKGLPHYLVFARKAAEGAVKRR